MSKLTEKEAKVSRLFEAKYVTRDENADDETIDFWDGKPDLCMGFYEPNGKADHLVAARFKNMFIGVNPGDCIEVPQ